MDRKAFLSQNAGGESTSAAFRLLDSPDIQAVQDFVENLKNFGNIHLLSLLPVQNV